MDRTLACSRTLRQARGLVKRDQAKSSLGLSKKFKCCGVGSYRNLWIMVSAPTGHVTPFTNAVNPFPSKVIKVHWKWQEVFAKMSGKGSTSHQRCYVCRRVFQLPMFFAVQSSTVIFQHPSRNVDFQQKHPFFRIAAGMLRRLSRSIQSSEACRAAVMLRRRIASLTRRCRERRDADWSACSGWPQPLYPGCASSRTPVRQFQSVVRRPERLLRSPVVSCGKADRRNTANMQQRAHWC